MANVLWKPYSEGGLNPGGTSFLLTSSQPRPRKVSVYSAGGDFIEDLSFGSTHEGAHKFYSRRPGASYGGAVQVRLTGDNGEVIGTYDIENSGNRYEGDVGGPLSFSSKAPGGGGGYPSGFAPVPMGPYGFAPGYLGGMFPQPVFANFQPIKPAKYKYTDPFDFAERYGEFSREELQKNFDFSQDMALSQLDTELAGMQKFVPAASALKRSETSLDNIFNQMQRSQQVDTALPGVRQSLEGQAARAEAFASGRLPDSIEDRALELGIRSRAADAANLGGFGVRSSVARKASDLMSAEQRVGLSRYGDQLLTQNIGTRANLLMAPTSYSDAGQQVRVMPEVGAGRLASQNLALAQQYGSIPASQALGTEVQQQQFKTQLVQGTNTFNAANLFNESLQNAAIANQFSMAEFGYNVGYAGALAGAAQTNTNTEVAIEQQKRAEQIYQDSKGDTQDSNTIGSIVQGIASIVPSVIGAFTGTSGGSGSASSGGASGGGAGGGGNLPVADYPSGESVGGSSDSLSIPSGSQAPSGYAPVATGSDGSTIVVPDTAAASSVRSFGADTGVPVQSTSPASSAELMATSSNVLRSAGITDTPAVNAQPIGVNDSGQQLYSDIPLLRSVDTSAGSKSVSTLQQVLKPLNVFSLPEDATTLDKIGAAARDAGLIAQLTDASQRGDTKGFINTLLSAVQRPIIDTLATDPSDKAGLASAFTAYQIAQSWDRMSPAQKSLSIAHLGLQGYEFASGENLGNKFLVKDPSIPGGGLTVGQGLALFNAGVNTYSLVKNWDQLNNLQKIAGGTSSVAQIAQLGRQFNLLGAGTGGAAVSGVTTANMASLGFKSAPQFGVGAMVGAPGANVPAGYVGMSGANGTVIVPAANADTAVGALSTSAGSLIQTAAGVAALGAGAYQVAKGWGQGGTQGAINGALGGSAMAAGLSTLAFSNPYLLGGVVAVSVLGNAIGTGKSGAQSSRDQVRDAFKQSGFIGDDYTVTLANGSKFDIGVDGHGQQHSFANPDKIVDGKNRTLNAWDIDYTNDLDYTAGMGGVALARLLTGGKATNIDQLGGQLGNAALSTVGHGKDYSQQNFGNVMSNMRSMYAQAGVKSKADAYQLANQAFAEGRIDESDLISMHQAFNMVFDNDYATGQKLMSGRWRGVEVASNDPSKGEVVGMSNPETEIPAGGAGRPTAVSAEAIENQFGMKGPVQNAMGTFPPGTDINQVMEYFSGMGRKGGQVQRATQALQLTKEQIRQLNQNKYISASA